MAAICSATSAAPSRSAPSAARCSIPTGRRRWSNRRRETMQKVVLPMVERVHQLMLAEFDRISLGDLCRESRLAGLASKCDGMVDFVIRPR